MKPRALLPWFLLLALAGCGGAQQAAAPTPTPKPAPPELEKPTYTVERGTVVDELKINGLVSPIKQQDLFFTQNGFVKTLYVDRTSVVTAGQLLAELDLGDLPNQQQQAQLEYDQAQAAQQRAGTTRALAVRRATLDLEDAQAKLGALSEPATREDATVAQASVAQASAALDETRATTSATKTKAELAIAKASDDLRLAQDDYVNVLRDWESIKDDTDNAQWKARHTQFLASEATLHQAEDALQQAKVDYDAAQQNERTAIAQAQAALTTAQAQAAGLTAKPKASAVADARRQIERAELALEEARQGSDPELEKRIAAAKLALERVAAQLNAGRLIAPFDGKIADLATAPGKEAKAYEPVLRVMNPSDVEVLVNGVSVPDGSKLGVGLPVTLVFSRYRGQAIPGTLERLPSSTSSSASSVNADTGYHISFDPGQRDFSIGDLAEIIVTLSKNENTLWLPPQAIRAFEGRRFVVVRAGDRQRRKDVKVGIISDDRVEVLSGLDAGEVVIGQ